MPGEMLGMFPADVNQDCPLDLRRAAEIYASQGLGLLSVYDHPFNTP